MERERLRLPPSSGPKSEERVRLPTRPREEEVGSYFSKPSASIKFISTGCAVLDCALGGGWPLGRIVNIVGDKSTGKTLLAIEAAANFYSKYEGHVWYCESEAAFDDNYAAALGLNIKRVLRPKDHVRTVEDFFNHLETAIKARGRLPGLYILDSLDALSDKSELERDFQDSTYGAQKAKKMSEAFRRIVRTVEDSAVCVMIISQIRDNITATFGRKFTRSGGKALDFYSSQTVYLAQLGAIPKTIKGVQRAVGLKVRAKVDKNKIGLPMRECEFPLRFGFGIDDVVANVNWLLEVDRPDEVPYLNGRNVKVVMSRLDNLSDEDYARLRRESAKAVRRIWSEVETRFIPTRTKYNSHEGD